MRDYPKSVKEAVKRLLLELPENDKLVIKNTPEEDLSLFHFTWANYVRNEFGLWDNNDELLKDCLPDSNERNPDDASAVIITALWKSLQASV